ncbi:MAG: hypothetical protein AAGA17_00330 [Actinomycetota bacterium]
MDLDDIEDVQSIDIEDDYVLVCAGTCYQASVQTYPNGTHVITVKGRR